MSNPQNIATFKDLFKNQDKSQFGDVTNPGDLYLCRWKPDIFMFVPKPKNMNETDFKQIVKNHEGTVITSEKRLSNNDKKYDMRGIYSTLSIPIIQGYI